MKNLSQLYPNFPNHCPRTYLVVRSGRSFFKFPYTQLYLVVIPSLQLCPLHNNYTTVNLYLCLQTTINQTSLTMEAWTKIF